MVENVDLWSLSCWRALYEVVITIGQLQYFERRQHRGKVLRHRFSMVPSAYSGSHLQQLQKRRETCEKLNELQGVEIPEFYDEYKFTRCTMETTIVSVIFLPFIADPPLVQVLLIPFQTALRIRALALGIMKKLHTRGV